MLRICIIGPEATGKSALFRLLSGEEPEDAMLSESFTPPVATVNFKDVKTNVPMTNETFLLPKPPGYELRVEKFEPGKSITP
jgi:ABC-type molybdenum transport system ATPase subunit/photorepair protein PhrA